MGHTLSLSPCQSRSLSHPLTPPLTQLPVKEGDLVVMGTDGLWDNLWEEQVRRRDCV